MINDSLNNILDKKELFNKQTFFDIHTCAYTVLYNVEQILAVVCIHLFYKYLIS